MKDREDLMRNKRAEIDYIMSNKIQEIMPEIGENEKFKIVESLYRDNVIEVVSPQQMPPIMQMITLDSISNYQNGASVKPGNILINFEKLIKSLPQIISASDVIIKGIWVLKICAILELWGRLCEVATIKIDASHAIVITALWKNCIGKNITLEYGFNCTNTLCRQLSKSEYSWEDYIKIVEQLEKNRSIELNESGIWLSESIQYRYEK